MANRLETVRVSHWPIAWLIYLPCTMTQCQSHCASNIIQLTSLSFQVSQPSHSSVTAISIFLPWKSKIKVMGEVKVWSHNVSLTFYRLTSLSFHVNQPSHSWDTAVSKVKVMGEVNVESHKVGVTSFRLTCLSFHVNRPFHSWHTAFSKFDLENPSSRSNDQDVACYRSTQFHRTSNGINPSSGFRDMRSAKSGPSAAWFDKFLVQRQAHMGQMGKWPWQCSTAGLDNSTEVRMEKIHQVVTEIWVPQIWQPTARPPEPWRQYPSSPDGWGVKNGTFDIPTKLQIEIKSNSHTL